jgi:hypothetical protein
MGMKIESIFNLAIFLLVALLLSGCAVMKPQISSGQWIGVTDLSSYHVEDKFDSPPLPIRDIILNPTSGEIEYIIVNAPLSGFGLDIRTAPYLSGQVILIPRRLASLKTKGKIFKLQIGFQELTNAPRFILPADTFPSDWREIVERYWTPYPHLEEQ